MIAAEASATDPVAAELIASEAATSHAVVEGIGMPSEEAPEATTVRAHALAAAGVHRALARGAAVGSAEAEAAVAGVADRR